MDSINPYRKPFLISSAVFLVCLSLALLLEISPLGELVNQLSDEAQFGLGFGLEGLIIIGFIAVASTAFMRITYRLGHRNALVSDLSANNQPGPSLSIPETISKKDVLLSYNGNIGQKKYWLGLVVVYFVALVIGALIVEQYYGTDYDLFSPVIHHFIITPIFLLLATPVIAKRMRDTGLSPYLMIPSLLFGFFLSISWLLVFILGVLPRKNQSSV